MSYNHAGYGGELPRGWLRLCLLGILVLGLLGTLAELLLLEHYEDPWQFVPLALIALALLVVVWNTLSGGRASVVALRLLMILFCIAAFIGLGLHFRGAVAFQREIDPSIAGWELVKKVMTVKAPPVLAPGVMLQLGLIGLVYAFLNSQGERNEHP